MQNKKPLVYLDDVRRAVLQTNPSAAFCLNRLKPVDAVEAALIKEAKQNILETLDILMATDAGLASYDGKNSYYIGKENAFEIARRLVNAALTNLVDNDGAKMDGGNAV